MKTAHINFRTKKKIKQQVIDLAEKEDRSMGKQISRILEQYFNGDLVPAPHVTQTSTINQETAAPSQ